MRRWILPLLLIATPAAADLPPHVYEQERAEAAHVLVIQVQSSEGLAENVSQGACRIEAVITGVERGDRQTGDTLSLTLPCETPDYVPPPGGFTGYRMHRLLEVRTARVWLDADGALVLRGFDSLD
ncbi:MAG: hypothetical protein ACK4FB_09265 [Brevundimonas sp.]|uniref:hypothetical protein n=1 Tax=Brevundimonas sp. TaxID=1871086 RepID=UPI00391D3F6F